MVTLIELLKQRQGKESDRIFATRLNITRSLWTQIKSGHRLVGLALLKGVVKVYPDLCPEVISFLRNSHKHE